jgi:hypothetical protein
MSDDEDDPTPGAMNLAPTPLPGGDCGDALPVITHMDGEAKFIPEDTYGPSTYPVHALLLNGVSDPQPR